MNYISALMPEIGDIIRKSHHKYVWAYCSKCNIPRWALIRRNHVGDLCQQCSKTIATTPRQKSCRKGHEFTAWNTLTGRHCRSCANDRRNLSRLRLRIQRKELMLIELERELEEIKERINQHDQ